MSIPSGGAVSTVLLPGLPIVSVSDEDWSIPACNMVGEDFDSVSGEGAASGAAESLLDLLQRFSAVLAVHAVEDGLQRGAGQFRSVCIRALEWHSNISHYGTTFIVDLPLLPSPNHEVTRSML